MTWRQGRACTARMAVTAVVLVTTGCSSAPTGLHVNVHLGNIAYDELRFGVLEAGADGGDAVTLVDPDTLGRKTGPFGPGDQDVVILLRDDIDGREIFCDVVALRGGAPAGTGDNAVLGQAHRIRDVDIFLTGAGPDDGGAPGDAATGTGGVNGAGGSGSGVDGGGGTGGGGGGGGGGTGGRPDAGTDVAAAGGRNGAGGAMAGTGGATAGTGALGAPCTTAGQCATLHCVDGVCCESACGTACFTCNLNPVQAGRCRQVANRAPDPRGLCVDTGAARCGTNGTCDGTGQCARYPFGTACPPACADAQDRFAAGICSLTGSCVGLGARVACPAPARACAAGRCL